MADCLFPDTKLFDELEFLQFSDDQFAAETDIPDVNDQENVFPPSDVTGSKSSSSSESSVKLTELKEAVAACTLGIYHSPVSFSTTEPDQDGNNSPMDGKTLNAMISGSTDDSLLEFCQSDSFSNSESTSVTSPISFSVLSKMSPALRCDDQYPDVSQSRIEAPEVSEAEDAQTVRTGKLKIANTSASTGHGHSYQTRRAMKVKHQVSKQLASEDKYFKSNKKMKRYQEKPFANPCLERSRLNAVNAKINRERKKQEMRELQERCGRLQTENSELMSSNQKLEERLRSAEVELSFLRRIVMNHLGIQDISKECGVLGHASAAGG